jgi:hypothetical protein
VGATSKNQVVAAAQPIVGLEPVAAAKNQVVVQQLRVRTVSRQRQHQQQREHPDVALGSAGQDRLMFLMVQLELVRAAVVALGVGLLRIAVHYLAVQYSAFARTGQLSVVRQLVAASRR